MQPVVLSKSSILQNSDFRAACSRIWPEYTSFWSGYASVPIWGSCCQSFRTGETALPCCFFSEYPCWSQEVTMLSSSELAVLRLQSSPAFGQPSSSAAFGGAAVSRLHPDCDSDCTQASGSNDCATHDAGIWAAKEPGSFWKQCFWGEPPAPSRFASLAALHHRAYSSSPGTAGVPWRQHVCQWVWRQPSLWPDCGVSLWHR